jgi:hypothetical protein
MFSGAPKHQLKPVRKFGLSPDLDAGATSGIIHDPAIKKWSFRVNDDFGRTRHAA